MILTPEVHWIQYRSMQLPEQSKFYSCRGYQLSLYLLHQWHPSAATVFLPSSVQRVQTLLVFWKESPGCDGPYFCRFSIAMLRCLQRQLASNILKISFAASSTGQSGSSFPSQNIFCRAWNLFQCITWNGISLELDCSIVTRETCNLDSLSTLDHLTGCFHG